MAILRAGILGGIRGKVAGVVGGQWKDKKYIREYIKPINPNTAAQQTQRTAFSLAVAFLRSLVGSVGNVYMDPLLKSMSWFNWAIKHNIKVIGETPTYASIKLTAGKCFPAAFTSISNDHLDGEANIVFSDALGNTGLATDKVYAAVYNADTGLWGFPAAEVARSAAAFAVPIVSSAEDVLHAYLFTARYSGAVVSQVSDSQYNTCVCT